MGAAQYVLKIGHADAFPVELHAQHDALSYLGAAGLPVPASIPGLDGQPLFARLPHYIEGQPLTRCGTLSPCE
jgi:Ser/Thr protein kinase RdoA (MazF antagonist)